MPEPLFTVGMGEDSDGSSIHNYAAALLHQAYYPPNRGPRDFKRMTVMAEIATRELSVKRSSSRKFDSILMASFSAALCLIFVYFRVTRVSSNDFTSHILGISMAIKNGIIYTCPTNTSRERIVVVVKCTSILAISWILIFISASACLNCIRLASTGSSIFQFNSFISFLFGQSPGCESQQACRECIGTLANILMVGNYFSLQTSRGKQSVIHDTINLENIQSNHQLVNYYNNWTKDTFKQDLHALNSELIYALAKDGKLTPESLSETMKTILCSPASRIDKPDPVTYMQSLKHPRFTSEDTRSITFEQLALIMRGDMLKKLGASVCFMLRFALAVEDDPKLEIASTSNTQLFPSMNEYDMQTTDITSQLPGIVIPGIDQDIDIEGANIRRTKNLMDIYTLFPFEDKALYFNTTEEYFAFFRWEIEPAIMDSWYFPHWLIKDKSKKDQIADLMSERVKTDSMYQLSFQDATSDIVLGERAVYGTGARFLSPIMLPGDDNYEFHLHMKHDQFLTKEHREYFRYTNKPSPEQLLEMLHSFYNKEFKKGTNFVKKIIKKDPLERYRKNILQIDWGFVATLPFREDFFAPGVILYLDSKSLLPIGIWESSRSKMFLPNSGRDWEHAKFMFRVCERAISTTFHVQESHFGWSNALANAAWQTLPNDHGLRALVKPFTLNVHSVNQAAYHMLVRDHSILTHASGLTTKGVIASFSQVFQTINFGESLPDFLESTSLSSAIDTSSIPLYSQGKSVYEATRQFVDEFVSFLYQSEEDLLQDGDVQLFWHHANTLGRHLDPCVCGLDEELFFGADNKWPSFESSQTCQQLLDFTKSKVEDSMVYRRKKWCDTNSFDRILAFREMIESDCKVNPECEEVKYDTFAMRADMGLPALTTRSQLVDFLSTAFWYVSFGHNLNSDNISYLVDPEYSSVRMREYDGDGALPIVSDVGSYVYGASIATLTTVRCPPLLADWSPLYERYANMQDNTGSTYETLNSIHLRYKYKLVDLATEFLKESSGRPVNQRTNVFNPATTASSVSV